MPHVSRFSGFWTLFLEAWYDSTDELSAQHKASAYTA